MRTLYGLIACLLLLAGCAQGAATNPPSTNGGTQLADVYIKYGVGGYATSYGMGPGTNSLAGALNAAFGSKIKIVGYYDWSDAIVAQMNATPPGRKLVEIGYSCGSSAVPQDTQAVSRTVDLAAGIQASLYCGGGQLAKNVSWAIEVYNPTCPQTLGLGCWLWPVGPGFIPGHFTIVNRYDMHPEADLDPDAWDDIVGALRPILNPTLAAPRTPMDDLKIHSIVRKSTWRH